MLLNILHVYQTICSMAPNKQLMVLTFVVYMCTEIIYFDKDAGW